LEIAIQEWSPADQSITLSIQATDGLATELKVLFRETRIVPLQASDKQLSITLHRMRRAPDGGLEHEFNWIDAL
jgi:hypothetical protein